MRISVVTPTCDRPIAFALAERYMRRQTLQPAEWIVADGGATPAPCTMGQVHIHAPRPPGALNFTANLLAGLDRARGDVLVIFEDDDFYLPEHIECMAELAQRFPLIGAEEKQRYYNVAHRVWRVFNNTGASLCQTAIRKDMWPAFRAMVRTMQETNRFGVDTNLWRRTPRAQWGIANRFTVLGIKGVPGLAGLGVGHRPTGPLWVEDPDLRQLREWIGDSDAQTYAPFAVRQAA